MDKINIGDKIYVPSKDLEGIVKQKFNYKDWGKIYNNDCLDNYLYDKPCVQIDMESLPWFFEEDCVKI
jgi:ASC-1-like (ASCH) protein